MMLFTSNSGVPSEVVNEFRENYMDFCTKERWTITASGRDWEYVVALCHVDFNPGDVVLDIGGGNSYILFYIADEISKGYIVDLAEQKYYAGWRETLADYEAYSSGKVEVIEQSAAILPFPDDSIDKAMTFSALEHFEGDDDTKAAQEVYRVLKPRGQFFGTVDFNHLDEYPIAPTSRVYTVESFRERVMSAAPFVSQNGTVPDFGIPANPNYVAPMFFILEKP